MTPDVIFPDDGHRISLIPNCQVIYISLHFVDYLCKLIPVSYAVCTFNVYKQYYSKMQN